MIDCPNPVDTYEGAHVADQVVALILAIILIMILIPFVLYFR